MNALADGIYQHPDGTRFMRTRFGYWVGDDGTQVDNTYIEFRVFVDAEDCAERMQQ